MNNNCSSNITNGKFYKQCLNYLAFCVVNNLWACDAKNLSLYLEAKYGSK